MKYSSTIMNILVLAFCGTSLLAQTVAKIETNHSSMGFAIPIAGGLTKTTGKFTDWSGEITWPGDNLKEESILNASVQIAIKVASVNTGIQMRDNDLLTDTFFDTLKYREISFRSKEIIKKEIQYAVIGDFSMKGVTKEIELPLIVTGITAEGVWGFAVRGKVNRLDYGVGNDWVHSAIPNFLGHDVELEVELWTKLPKKIKK